MVTRYVSGSLSFGSVLATLTATMGDAAFLLIAKEPTTGLFIMGLGLFVGTITGYTVDGIHGKDITDKMQQKVPIWIHGKPAQEVVQITGELVAPKTIPNARNYAAGALNLKDLDEFMSRNVSFVAYDMQPSHLLRWTGTMEYLFISGFATVHHLQDDIYPTDGLVYRMNENKVFDKQGYTAHHPKGAFALKEKKEGVITTLIDVIWQTGKSGVVTPVGILDPVTIGDAVIQKATLHNIDYIRSLNLEIGCKVEVIRSGEIIPRILRRVDEK